MKIGAQWLIDVGVIIEVMASVTVEPTVRPRRSYSSAALSN
jgi:hypothetical protein